MSERIEREDLFRIEVSRVEFDERPLRCVRHRRRVAVTYAGCYSEERVHRLAVSWRAQVSLSSAIGNRVTPTGSQQVKYLLGFHASAK